VQRQIPLKMQCMIWFAGLRGAIAFALSQNMPGPHKGAYETTTLGVVFFTTLVCGGLTEKVLALTGMKRTTEDLPVGQADAAADTPPPPPAVLADGRRSGAAQPPLKQAPKRGFHQWWGGVDARVMKPLFGGRPRDVLSDHDGDALKPLEQVPMYPLTTDALLSDGNLSDH
jgi:sodium/hydrogen exchanger 8